MSEVPEENTILSELLTQAIHQGNCAETERLLNVIREIGGKISDEVNPNPDNSDSTVK